MNRAFRLLVAAATLLTAAAQTSPPRPRRSVFPAELAVFLDRETGFSTNDVYDAQDQACGSTRNGDLIWAATGRALRWLHRRRPCHHRGRDLRRVLLLCDSDVRRRGARVPDVGRRARAEHPAAVLDVEIVRHAPVSY